MPAIDIITLADAKTQLNKTATTDDAEIGTFITAASQMWVNRCGPVVSTSFTEVFPGGTGAVALNQPRVIAVQTVTEAILGSTTATTLTAGYDYFADTARGIVYRLFNLFPWGPAQVTVTYTAGFASTPADITLAVKLLVQHMWDTQRGAGKRPGLGGDEWTHGMAFTWPDRVEEIAARYMMGGIA